MLRDAQRILRELKKAKMDNNDELWLKAKEDNIRNWIGVMKAPPGTPFEGHYYQIDIIIPDGYPLDPPKAKFVTPIFHPNVHFKKGKICLNILKTEWTPAWSIQTLCTAVSLLMSHPAPDSPLNTLAGNLLRCGDEVGYHSMAAMYARKFAPSSNFLREENEAAGKN